MFHVTLLVLLKDEVHEVDKRKKLRCAVVHHKKQPRVLQIIYVYNLHFYFCTPQGEVNQSS